MTPAATAAATQRVPVRAWRTGGGDAAGKLMMRAERHSWAMRPMMRACCRASDSGPKSASVSPAVAWFTSSSSSVIARPRSWQVAHSGEVLVDVAAAPIEVLGEELGVGEVVAGHARASSSRSSARSLRTARKR